MLLTVFQATAQGVCVFAQTHEKLEGTLLLTERGLNARNTMKVEKNNIKKFQYDHFM